MADKTLDNHQTLGSGGFRNDGNLADYAMRH